MKKVTIFVGSGHKRLTHNAAALFAQKLQALGEVEVEIVTLSDYHLGICRGCRVCFMKGEAFCPLKDDRDVLFAKIAASDGVVFATPNYCFQMSGLMKVFLDRFGFIYHRPRYFGKAFTSIVSQGFGGGDKILKDLSFGASLMGFDTVKGAAVTGLDPYTEKDRQKADKTLTALSKRFYQALSKPANVAPTLMQMLIFRIGRSTVQRSAEPGSVDYQYYAERGWLDAEYYYPTRLGLLQRAAGRLMDAMSAMMWAVMG